MAANSIYLDYAATTPVAPEVVQAMLPYLQQPELQANAASMHALGQQAAQAVAKARAQVGALLNADAEEIIFTSGATEAINLAIKGVVAASKPAKPHIITSQIEHKAALDSCAELAAQGVAVDYVPVTKAGVIEVQQLADLIRPETVLVSIMYVNNETGVIQPVAEVAELCQQRQLPLHVDAAQAVGKLAIDLKALPVSLLSLSGHKFYGPKGVGALYVRRRPKVAIKALMHGGGHELGLRSGTLATHQIVAMGAAAQLAQQCQSVDWQHLSKLNKLLVQALETIPAVTINGAGAPRVPHILSFSVQGVSGEALHTALRQLAVSAGSACNSHTIMPSHVLQAMQLSTELCLSTVRLSLGRTTTTAEVERALAILSHQINRLQALCIPS